MATKTKVEYPDVGYHNRNLDQSIQRIQRGNTYKNVSTIWLVPTRGVVPSKVVSSWMALQKPMNQPFYGPIFLENMEVGEAYQAGFEMVLNHPELSKWRYIFTSEEDNILPSDCLLRLYESIEKYDCVAGIYWTKFAGGMPMIYGDVNVLPRNFVPQLPIPDSIQPCNGLGMGCNLWKIETFKKKLKDMPKPWFKTVQEKNSQFSQDLWFFNSAASYGFRCACDTRVKSGHLDVSSGTVW